MRDITNGGAPKATMPARSDRPSAIMVSNWHYAPDAWRWARRLNHRFASTLLRVRSARVLPQAMRARFTAMGIPRDTLESTLMEIRSTAQWSDAWIETAQRHLGEYRRQVSSKNTVEAAQARRIAALCYHAAQVFSTGDDRTVRMCRAAAASLFAQAQPYTLPGARRIDIPWRSTHLPAYFQPPPATGAPTGLVVLLNGVSTSKEESLAWSEAFLRAGLAILAVDSPGTGEATGLRVAIGDDDDILDGVFDVFRGDPTLDLAQVSIVGVSLGGNQAVRCAGYDRRIMSVVAVTPPFDPARWLHRANPILLSQLTTMLTATHDDLFEQAARLSLYDLAAELRTPTLVFGGARDLMVPPTESQLLAARLGAVGTLVWHPGGGHCLYDHMRSWSADAAIWISSIAAARAFELQSTGKAEPELVVELAREELESAENPAYDDESSARAIDEAELEADLLGSSARIVEPAPRPVVDETSPEYRAGGLEPAPVPEHGEEQADRQHHQGQG